MVAKFCVHLPATVVFDYPSLQALSEHIAALLEPSAAMVAIALPIKVTFQALHLPWSPRPRVADKQMFRATARSCSACWFAVFCDGTLAFDPQPLKSSGRQEVEITLSSQTPSNFGNMLDCCAWTMLILSIPQS